MKDLQINNIFSSFLIEREIDLDHAKITDLCADALETFDDYHQKNIFHNPDLMVEFKDLFVEIDRLANEAHKLLQYKQDTKQVCIDAWINDYGSLNTAVPHQHPTADLAIVYFPKAEKGCDTLELLNPNSKLQYVIHDEMVEHWNNYNSYTWNIIPKTGKVVVFPGYVMHYVKQGDWNKKRVSIAFNYKVAW
tara:strand:- start:1892 stop:2467 length:576 start_codon:yes stop_codon:yes gene_type:complete